MNINNKTENIINQVVDEKLNDAMTPTVEIEFTPDEAEKAGAFIEDAISVSDAEESQIDGDAYIMGFEQIKEQKTEINLEQVKDNQNTILDSIKKALDGYKAIETWENLSNVAKENGLNCYLTNDVPNIEGDSRIIYVDNNDNILPIYTELSHGDGKAVTYINDERVKGTGFTSDFSWQKDALNNAIDKFNTTLAGTFYWRDIDGE